MAHRVHQIFYSEQTRAANDPGFLPLDYLSNERPDWREYWPIRKFLLQGGLDEDCAYGFFSPKFRQKTGLGANEVHRFIDQADADVFVFSPFFDQSALFLNVFEQAGVQHPGMAPTLAAAMELIEPGVPATRLVMNSTNTVFCNYFVAKPRFWRAWLAMCERLFDAVEAGSSDLAQALNANVDHLGGAAPTKVFVIERVASLLLTLRRDFKVRAFDPVQMPKALPSMNAMQAELCLMDALKIAYSVQPNDAYLGQFARLRSQIVERLTAPAA
jgi:hypothetical protein